MNALAKRELLEPFWLSVVQSQVGSLRYGVVQIVVHDSRVVEVERTERLRFDQPGLKPSASAGLRVARPGEGVLAQGNLNP